MLRRKWNFEETLSREAVLAPPPIVARASGPVPSYLAKILRGGHLTPHFQPIYSSRDGHVFGYEALARPLPGTVDAGGVPVDITQMFRDAAASGVQAQLDVLCREAAIREAMAQELTASAVV